MTTQGGSRGEALSEAAEQRCSNEFRVAMEHRAKTGAFRLADVYKILGSPMGSAEAGPGMRPDWAAHSGDQPTTT
jgi:hypothetical protein